MTAARPRFGGLLSSELRKLGTLPAVRTLLIVAVLLGAGSAWLFGAVALTAPGGVATAEVVLRTVDYLQAALLILGVMAITSEYRTPVRTTLTVTPTRLRVHLAKALALLLPAGAAAVAAIASGFAVARLVLGERALAPDAAALGRLASAAGYLVALAVLGFVAGTLLRHTVGAVAVVLGYFFIAAPLLRQYARLGWTPDAAGQALWNADPGLAPGPAGLLLTGWTLGLLAVAAAAFRLRDA